MDNINYKEAVDLEMPQLQNKLLMIFNESGIDLDVTNIEEPLELDSLHYISIICEMENEFGIEVTDDVLHESRLSSFKDFLMLLKGDVHDDI